MRNLILSFIVISVLQTFCSAGEYIKKVDLNGAIQAALENNIDLQVAQLDINIAKNEIKSANRLQNPSFDAFYFLGAAGWSEPKQLGMSQNVEIAKRHARKNLAKSNLKLAEKNVDYTKFDLKMDVRKAYINLVAAKSILDTLEQQKKLQEELLKIAQNRVKSKQVTEIDAVQAEIALNQLITQVNTAKVNVKTASSAFNKIINDPDHIVYDTTDKLFSEENNFEEMLTPPPDFKFPPFSDIVQIAMNNRYDIQIAKQEIDIAEKNMTVAARQKIPDIALTGGYTYQTSKHTDSGHFNSGAYAGASLVNIPLLYNYSPEIQNAAFKVRQTELKYESVKNKAVKDVSAAYERFLTAVENLNYYESKILKGSEKLIDMSKNSYETGQSDITSLIVMKQSYKSIIVGYTYALTEYYNSWTDFLCEVNDENFALPENL